MSDPSCQETLNEIEFGEDKFVIEIENNLVKQQTKEFSSSAYKEKEKQPASLLQPT